MTIFSLGNGYLTNLKVPSKPLDLNSEPNHLLSKRHNDFMLKKYGQEVIDQLRFLHKNNSYKYKLVGLGLYYKQEYQNLVDKIKRLRSS